MYHCQNVHCSQRNIERIIEHLSKAKYSIDLAMYSFSSIELACALKMALGRKVVIRLIVSRHWDTKVNSQLANLIRWGAQLRTQNSSYFMHHKFCVIDGQARVDHIWRQKKRKYGPETTYSVLINGSLNWTDGGIGANWENVHITSHAQMATEFQSEFDRMWKAFADKSSAK